MFCKMFSDASLLSYAFFHCAFIYIKQFAVSYTAKVSPLIKSFLLVKELDTSPRKKINHVVLCNLFHNIKDLCCAVLCFR